MKSASSKTACSISIVLALALTLNQTAHAAHLPHILAAPQAAATAPPPPPARIASARTVFLTNAGADPNFPIDSTQSYSDVYAALEAWGHYQLVNSADQADLVFELHEVSPVTGVTGIDGDVDSYTSPAFQLKIRDPKTNAILWTVTSPVELAGRKQELARWVSLSETNLVSRIKVLAGDTLTASETEGLTTVPNYHVVRRSVILIGVGVGAAAVGALLIHHAYENSLADQKASQDQFCQQHGIPLSECAGG